MNECSASSILPHDVLVQIISIQSEIVKLGPDLGGVMDLVAKHVQQLTDSSGAIVELAEGDEMVYRAATGIAESQLGLRLQRSTSLSGLCIETGAILQCHDSETDQRVDRMACRKVGLRSMIVSPLFHNEKAVGVLKVTSSEPDYFNEKHLCILQMLSETIAASMFYSAEYDLSRLYYRATHDMLTGIANRALFYDNLRQQISQALRRAVLVSVLYMDIDNLKPINDRFGHRAGDAVIREVASRLKSVSRQSDTVARLGGDEFGIILSEIKSRDCAKATAERIATDICRPLSYEDQLLPIGASIGMALYPEDAEDLDLLIEKADKAMYENKRKRRSCAP